MNTTYPNSPDFKPVYEELRSCLFLELGDTVALDITARVYNEDVYDIDGTLIFQDSKGNELASVKVNDSENIKLVNDLFSVDIKQRLFEEAYRI